MTGTFFKIMQALNVYKFLSTHSLVSIFPHLKSVHTFLSSLPKRMGKHYLNMQILETLF